MKKIIVAALTACMCLAGFSYSKYVTPADLGCKEAVKGETLELGQWYTNFEACKSYADDNGIPMVAVWSNHGCIHCYYLDICFLQQEFIDWQKTSDAAQVVWCFMGGGESGYPDQAGSVAYNWMYKGGGTIISQYPFVVLWWKDGGVNVRSTGDAMRNGLSLTDAYIPQSTKNVIANIESAFSGWSPVKSPALDDVSFISKTMTTYENAGVYEIEVTRTVGTNKAVSAVLKTDYSGTKIKILNDSAEWAEGETGSRFFRIEIADDEESDADETIDFTLETDADSSKIPAATLTIADDDKKAPTFPSDTVEYDAVQYASVSDTVCLKTFGKNLTVKKTGSLPTGIKITLDATTKCLVVSGAPTKAGTFTAAFQATEVIDGQRVTGNTLTMTFNVTGISEAVPRLASTVTLKNGLVMNNGELIGLMNLSIPKTGKASARYVNADSTVSFTTTGWTVGEDCLTTTSAVNSKIGAALTVSMTADGLVQAYIGSADSGNEVIFDYARSWTKDEFAEYAGTYNVSICQTGSTNPAAGDGYLTIKVSAASYKAGTVQVAGALPDGTTFSTSTTLQYDYYRELAIVPIFVKTSYGSFSAVASLKDGKVGLDKSYVSKWSRTNRYAASLNTKETTKLAGSLFVKNSDVADTALTNFGATNLTLAVDSSKIAAHEKLGKALDIALPNIIVKKDSISIDKTYDNPCKLSLSYVKSAGYVKGTIKIPFENGTVTGSIRGFMLDSMTIPVLYSGKVDGKTVKCGFNIVVSVPEEDCGCD